VVKGQVEVEVDVKVEVGVDVEVGDLGISGRAGR